MISATAIILAGGKSKRAKKDKLFLKINNNYLINHTLLPFLNITEVKEIILVLSKKNIKRYSHIFDEKIRIVNGGKTRIESLLNASRYISRKTDIILVHDGARPFVSKKLIKKIIKAAYSYGAVVPVIPIKDTVKEVDIEKGIVIKTLERSKLCYVQTPQGYNKEIFEMLIRNIPEGDPTDDSQIVEKLNIPVHTVSGEETNIKITTPFDIEIMEAVYESIKRI